MVRKLMGSKNHVDQSEVSTKERFHCIYFFKPSLKNEGNLFIICLFVICK